jgi:hypothetical protein
VDEAVAPAPASSDSAPASRTWQMLIVGPSIVTALGPTFCTQLVCPFLSSLPYSHLSPSISSQRNRRMTVTANDLVGTLSGTTAHGLALGFAFIFVGSLYVSNHTRLSFDHNVKVSVGGYQRTKQNNERWRDDPDVIRARLAAVSIASVICCAIVGYLLSDLTHSKVCNSLNNIRENALTRIGSPLVKTSNWLRST